MAKPTLHFAHANGIVSDVYRKFFGELEKTFEIKYLPALGLDPKFPVDNNWHSLAEQVRDSIETRCDGPVIGLGHSLGGVTTFMAAYKYPQLFRGLILLDPPAVTGMGAVSMGAAKLFGFIDRVTPAGRSKGRRDVWPSRDEAARLLRPKGLFRSFDQDCFDDYIRYGLSDCEQGVCLTVPVATEVDIFRTTPTNDWAFRKQLSMPSAMITGAESPFNAAGFVDTLAKRHHMLQRRTPGQHMFPLEHPLETAQCVTASARELGLVP